MRRRAREKDGASTPPLIVETPFYREDGDGYFGEARFALYLVECGARWQPIVVAQTYAEPGNPNASLVAMSGSSSSSRKSASICPVRYLV